MGFLVFLGDLEVELNHRHKDFQLHVHRADIDQKRFVKTVKSDQSPNLY